jgi:hypothetical protein
MTFHDRVLSHDHLFQRKVRGNVGTTVLTQLRETIAVILDVP